MAELNLRLNDGKLPIEDELLSSKKQKKMIEDLTDKKYFSEATKSDEIIKKDMKRLTKNLSKNIINDFFDIVNKRNNSVKTNAEPKRKDSLKMLTDEERRTLDDIHDLIEDDKKVDAEIIINQKLAENMGKTQFVFYLYDMRTVIYKSVSDKAKMLIDSFDKMIDMVPNSEENYVKAFRYVMGYENKIKYLNKAIDLFPNDNYLYNEKAEYLLDNCLDYWDYNGLNNIFEDIKNAIDRSLEINGTAFNRAWLLKCDYLKHLYEKDIDKAKSEISKVLTSFSNVKSKYFASAYELYYKLLGMSEQECENKLKEYYDYSLKTDDLNFVEHCAISLMNFYVKLCRVDDFERFVREYEEEYIPSEDFLYNKAYSYVKYFAKFDKGEEIISNSNNSSRWKTLMFEYFYDTNQTEKAKKVLERYFNNDTMKWVQYYSLCDDEKVIELLENYWETNPHTIVDISLYACSCLKVNQVEKAYKLCKKYYDNPDYFEGVLYINYFLADQAYNKKDVSSKVRSKIIEKKELYSNIVLAAAYAIVNDRNNMYSSLIAAVKEKILFKFAIMSWPVFEKYKNEDKFKKLADYSELMNFESKIVI